MATAFKVLPFRAPNPASGICFDRLAPRR
ncbi:UNVERIFIED_CONTAM: hypothetical protein GTU68_023693 [Idotea baltica]|nr:hypothetical protein [Idotea baltica]